jgi:hypothetical protein
VRTWQSLLRSALNHTAPENQVLRHYRQELASLAGPLMPPRWPPARGVPVSAGADRLASREGSATD